MKMVRIRTGWIQCPLLVLLLFCMQVMSQPPPDPEPTCSMSGVRNAPGPTEPHLATDCIAPDPLKAGRVNWKPNNDYSYGGADDFCLHTQISDDKNILESRLRVYRGVGNNFPVIQKLVRGSAWSFQRDGPLETVNMDWSFSIEHYKTILEKLSQKYIEAAMAHSANLTMYENIREMYKEKGWDPKGLKFRELDATFHAIRTFLLQPSILPDPDKEIPGFATPDKKGGIAHIPKGGGFVISEETMYTVKTWVHKPELPEVTSIDSAGVSVVVQSSTPSSTTHLIMKASEMYEIMKKLDAMMEDKGLNWPVDPDNKYLQAVERIPDSDPNKEHYLDIRKFMHEMLKDKFYGKSFWELYREDLYYKWRRERFMEMHEEFGIYQKDRRRLLVEHCYNHVNLIKKHFRHLGHLLDNLENSPFAAQKGAPNPYFVEVSAITVNHELLKNFLHIRVFMNRSESDDRMRLHSEAELKDKAKGRMKAVIIIVKDQEGFPVGDFGRPIPCDKTCDSYSGPVHRHDTYQNDLPCVFTPPTANSHPGIYIWPGGEMNVNDSYEGIRELHATWNFAQDSCNFVTELHIQTLILEELDIQFPGTDRFDFEGACLKAFDDPDPTITTPKCTSDRTDCTYPGIHHGKDPPVNYDCLNKTDETLLTKWLQTNCKDQGRGHLFGWTARYNILHPTLTSLGAPDYVDIVELKERSLRGGHINCHVPLKDDFGFTKGHVPKGMTKIPSITPYFLKLMSEFNLEYQDLDVWYYGTHYNGRLQCRQPVLNDGAGESAVAELKKILGPPEVEEFMKAPGIRCPCPALPTTPDPEGDSVTADPSRLHGRLLHASHMALAWMLLVPLSIFVVRYYKETFALVFCVQEYWWFAWHVGLLFASAVFIMGGILAVAARKTIVKIVDTDELKAHKIMGTFSIVLFYIQIFTGFIRSADQGTRFRQIFTHWILGILNQTVAIVAIIVMGFARESGMSCNALIASGAWFLFYVTMFVIMEIHIRSVDRTMDLEPKRTYAPPPMKRLFGRDAPRRNFRIVMLGIFLIVMLAFYFLMAYFIWFSEGVSCQDERAANAGDSGGGDDSGPKAEKEDDYVYLA